MKRKLTKISIGLLIVNFISYWLFSDVLLEKTVYNKYTSITELRPIEYWDGVTTEYVIVSSCGDELFRNSESFEKVVLESKPKNKIFDKNGKNSQLVVDNNFQQVVHVKEEQIDVIGSLMSFTDTTSQSACVVFKACVLRSIPILFKKIEFKYFFSSTPNDYHSLYYNGQSVSSTPYYIWILGKWFEIGGELQGIQGDY